MTKKSSSSRTTQEKKSPKPKHTAGTFTVREDHQVTQEHRHKRNDGLLIFLGFIIGATLIGFIITAMSSQRDVYRQNSSAPLVEGPADVVQERSDDLTADIDAVTQVADNSLINEQSENDDASSGSVDDAIDAKNTNPQAVSVTDDDAGTAEPTSQDVQKASAPVQPKTTGEWYLVTYNNEQFDIEDEGDDVSEITFDHVCGGVNRGITTYCKNTSKLRKTTAEKLGARYCGKGTSCRIGQSCLLWNAVTEDDGDVEMKTAVYTCA